MKRQIVFSLLFIFSLYLCHIVSYIQGFNTCTDFMYQEIHYQLTALTDRKCFGKLFGPTGKEVQINYRYLMYDLITPFHDTYRTFMDSIKNSGRL